MSGGIFLLDSAGELTEMAETAFAAEIDLQKLLADHPGLIPGDQIDPGFPRRWLLVSREVGIPDQEQGGARWGPGPPFPGPGRRPHPCQWMRKRSPFDSREKRLELLRRLNEVLGMAIPEDGIERRPSIPLRLLAEGGRVEGFLGVLDWAVGEVRGA